MLKLIKFSLLGLLISVLPYNLASAGKVSLPRTGQTICSDASGAPILCAGTGQDGDKLKGVTSPSPRFTDNLNGTVTDNLTGLIWLKNANCFSQQNWPAAVTSANTLTTGACGLSDGSTAGQWRLANINELASLVDLSQLPALPTGHPFIIQSYYWSSSSYANNASFAWSFNTTDGSIGHSSKGTTFYVWPVRGGQ